MNAPRRAKIRKGNSADPDRLSLYYYKPKGVTYTDGSKKDKATRDINRPL